MGDIRTCNGGQEERVTGDAVFAHSVAIDGQNLKDVELIERNVVNDPHLIAAIINGAPHSSDRSRVFARDQSKIKTIISRDLDETLTFTKAQFMQSESGCRINKINWGK